MDRLILLRFRELPDEICVGAQGIDPALDLWGWLSRSAAMMYVPSRAEIHDARSMSEV